MARLIFFILTFGFIIQCSGIAVYMMKSVNKTEQCPDDDQPCEENSTKEFKKDKEQIGINFINEISTDLAVYTISDIKQDCPPGFYNKHYLPPRYM